MKLLRQNIERKTGAGEATLYPEEPEDMVRSYFGPFPTDLLTYYSSGMPTISSALKTSYAPMRSARSSSNPPPARPSPPGSTQNSPSA
jgi:hypothetical protein